MLYAKKNSGQAMLLTVLALGGTILGATTIAGLLMVYQIRQATDLANSQKAIFVADAGAEWGLYQFFKGVYPAPVFSNGATLNATCLSTNCLDSRSPGVSCADPSVAVIKSIGKANQSQRAFCTLVGTATTTYP
jgi:hypothetical protein